MLLLFLPAAPQTWEIFQRRENWASFVPLPTLAELTTERFARRVAPWAWYLAPGLVCLLLGGWRRRRPQPSDREQAAERKAILTATITWIAAPIAAAWLLSVTDIARLFFYRYLIAPASAAPLLAGLLCGLGATKQWRVAAATATIAAALCYVGPDYAGQFSRDHRLIADRDEDWRSAVAYVNSQDDRLPVLLYAGLIETSSYADSPDPLQRDYCLLPVRGIYDLNESRHAVMPLPSLRGGELAPETCQAAASMGGVWLLLRVPWSAAAEATSKGERLLADSSGHNWRVTESQTFGGVTAARIESNR